MGWDSRRHYPVDVSKTVTVQATPGQKGAWTAAAHRYGKGTAGGFLAWAGDLVLAMAGEWERFNGQHEERVNPPGSKL